MSAPEPTPGQRAAMARLTVRHHFDPATGFIVADEVVALPAVLRDAPPLAVAADRSRHDQRTLVVFATADRCAPCQQFKRDALNDPRVVALLESGRFLVAHVEVDRERADAQRVLGGGGIPVSYALRGGAVADRLPGQRSADELLAWLDGQ